MKLFQIEEPDGTPLEAEGPGAVVGIDVDGSRGGAVAIAVGGNPEILPGSDGARRLAAPGLLREGARFDDEALRSVLTELRGRAEKQLARPVTHAVIAADLPDQAAEVALAQAAAAAGITVLRLLSRKVAASRVAGAATAEAAVFGAAIEAEDLAPPSSR